jgi:hypothetical protein
MHVVINCFVAGAAIDQVLICASLLYVGTRDYV